MLFGKIFDIEKVMRKSIVVLLILFATSVVGAQEMTLVKGKINEVAIVNDSISETAQLYLPTSFTAEKKWPVLFVFDLSGTSSQALRLVMGAAEENGFVVATASDLTDTLSVTKNILISSRMIDEVSRLISIDPSQVYVAGQGDAGRFAAMLPSFIKPISGIVSFGGAIDDLPLILDSSKVEFVGVVGDKAFNYIGMFNSQEQLNQSKVKNRLFVFEGGNEWPITPVIKNVFSYLRLSAMSKGVIAKDTAFVRSQLFKALDEVKELEDKEEYVLASKRLVELRKTFRFLEDSDTLKVRSKKIARNKIYRAMYRKEQKALFNESLQQEDYSYYLLEDLETLNLNNIGWWRFQVEQLETQKKNENRALQKSAVRLLDYLSELTDDTIETMASSKVPDDEGLLYVNMLKTVVEPSDVSAYITSISLSAKMEDFATSLFYLEELLKQGFVDKNILYTIPNTALLRISPEYNDLVNRYLKDSRYDVKE